MQKFLIVAALISAFAVPAFSEKSSDNDPNFKMRMETYKMQWELNESEIQGLQVRMEKLTAYQRALKNMMDNELESHRSN